MRTWSRASPTAFRPEARSGRALRCGAAVALLALLPASAARAQQGQRSPLGRTSDPRMVDQGSFQIRLGDRPSGSETFALRRDGDGFTAVGRIVVEGQSVWIRSLEVGLHTNADLSPERYEARTVERPVSRFVVSRTGSRLRLSASTERGERVTEFLVRPDLMLLERGIAHQYWFLVRRLREIPSSASPGLEVLMPASGEMVPVALTGTAEDSVAVGGFRLAARRYDLTIGSDVHRVWADSEGRILRAEIPARGWTARRQPAEGQTEPGGS